MTTDALKLVAGDFNPEALEHATWEDAGLIIHIRRPLLRSVKDHSDEFANLTVDDIDYALRRGLAAGDFTLRAAGLAVDLKALFDKHSERYAGWMGDNICDGVFDGFRGVRSVILVGRRVELVEDWLKEWYGDRIPSRDQHATTRNNQPVDMNAVGGLRLSLMRQRQAR